MLQHVDERDLASKTSDVIDIARHGDPVIVDRRGKPEAAILDVADYRILKAALRYFTSQDANAPAPETGACTGLDDHEIEALTDVQDRYDLVLSRYLRGSISLGRAAELLGFAWIDLRNRFARTGVPLALGPINDDEVYDEVRVALSARRMNE